MSESKQRLSRKSAFLKEHSVCIYCGSASETSDHCPPRVFFANRQWPEGYEFAACSPCNARARLDEQALAFLMRTKLSAPLDAVAQKEWEAIGRGVRNNQPDLIAEWTSKRRNEVKRDLRDIFGPDGDKRRAAGWTTINMGSLTMAMIRRFMIKLGKSLYYKHNGHIFDGVMYVTHIPPFSRDVTPAYMADILRMAPASPELVRNRKSLADQFLYRFNYSPEHRVMYAVAQFSEQFVFQIIALSHEMETKLLKDNSVIDVASIPAREDCGNIKLG